MYQDKDVYGPQDKPLIPRTPRNFVLCLIAVLVGLVALIQLIEWVRHAI
jgi:hypothetical protein